MQPNYLRVAGYYYLAKAEGTTHQVMVNKIMKECRIDHETARAWLKRVRVLGLINDEPSESSRMSKEERAEARKQFEDGDTCKWCGGLHARACPRVKRLKVNSNGSEAEAEFWPHGDWPEDNIIWPEDVVEIDDEDEAGR